MIAPNEIELAGKWFVSQGRSVADETSLRIVELTKNYLVELGHDSSGWDTLYRDPSDGRFWELIYPQAELQGGGPTQLRCLSADEVRRKYGDIVIAI